MHRNPHLSNVEIRVDDPAQTGHAGLLLTGELAGRSGLVARLDRAIDAIRPFNVRRRGRISGELLVALAELMVVGGWAAHRDNGTKVSCTDFPLTARVSDTLRTMWEDEVIDHLGDVLRGVAATLSGLALPASGFVIIWLLPLSDRYLPNVGPWDEHGLRLGLVILAALVYFGGLGIPKHLQDLLPSGPLWILVLAASIALTLLQYVALGGGQPLWAAEHVIVHVLELVGVQPTDVEGLTSLIHRHLAPSVPVNWIGNVESARFAVSTIALVLLGFGTILWAGYATEWLTEPWAETQ